MSEPTNRANAVEWSHVQLRNWLCEALEPYAVLMPEVEEPPSDVQLSVDSVTLPDGTPVTLLDFDLGLVISGKVTMPNSVIGTGQVRVYVSEIGGLAGKSIGSDSLTFTSSTPATKPGATDYPWSVVIPPHSNVFPESERDASQVYQMAVVFTHDQRTDIEKGVDMGAYLIV